MNRLLALKALIQTIDAMSEVLSGLGTPETEVEEKEREVVINLRNKAIDEYLVLVKRYDVDVDTTFISDIVY